MNFETIKTRMAGHEPAIMETKREHAVLIPLIETEEGLCIVFEKRAASIKQPGEVCLPGGKIEKGETAKDAALREFTEELGVGTNVILEFVGQFDTQVTHSHMNQYTFIAKLTDDALSKMNPNPSEVARIFTIPVDYLMNTAPILYEFPLTVDANDDSFYDVMGFENHTYKWLRGSLSLPIWKYDGEILWGITGRIIRHFLTFFKD